MSNGSVHYYHDLISSFRYNILYGIFSLEIKCKPCSKIHNVLMMIYYVILEGGAMQFTNFHIGIFSFSHMRNRNPSCFGFHC